MTEMPERIQNLRQPGYEQMSDDHLAEEVARLDAHKIQLENQLKGTNTALETALTVLDERHP